MSDLPVKPNPASLDDQPYNGLVIEAINETSLREARERKMARLRRLWNNRRFLLRVTAVGLVVSTALAFLTPKRYTSVARLMPPDQSSGGLGSMLAALTDKTGLGAAGGLAAMAESALGIRTTAELFIGILQSETVQDDLIHKFNLQKRYHDRYLYDARKDLASHTDIDEDRKNGILTIKVTDRDPGMAHAMAQEYVDQLNWVVNHLSTSSARRERIFLEEEVKKSSQRLEDDEKAFSRFASKNTAIDIPEQGKAMLTSASFVQGQLIAAESQLEGLRQIYTDNNARVRTLQAQVNELKQQLEKLSGKGGEPADPNALYPSIRQLPVLGVPYADLYRNVKVDEVIFAMLTQQYEAAKVKEAREIPTVMVLDVPQVPKKKSFPPHILLAFLGTLLSLIGGVVWVLGHAAWHAADPGDPGKALAADVMNDVSAMMPWRATNGSRAHAAWSRTFGRFANRKNAVEEDAAQTENLDAGNGSPGPPGHLPKEETR
ncbi:MAG TPA: GNVR domain-containing protein [Candidatus Acidoferrales bacterium]|nr:GNVR domain-containing protein [Candidatus Acidoferrales bacterium]